MRRARAPPGIPAFQTTRAGKVYAISSCVARDWIARHPVWTFYALAYAFSWSIAVPLALQALDITSTTLPWSLHYLTAFGPMLAAITVARVLRTAGAPRHAEARPVDRRHALGWSIVGFASPLVLFEAARVSVRFAGGAPPSWQSLGAVSFMPNLGLGAWAMWFVTNGIGEELGWRGFALPCLQRTHSALASSALLTLAWGAWHLPAFFYLPGYAAIGAAVVPGFFLGLFAGSIVLTWLFNKSGGYILGPILWHASFNFVTASPNASGLPAALTSMAVIVWAIVILLHHSPETLVTRRRSVRANTAEETKTLPGDELIQNSVGSFTHAITIARASGDVWPWLVQMGAGTRAGWYSYDAVDNGRKASAGRIVPELQRIEVGTIFPALPGVRDGFTLLAFEVERFLLLGWLKDGSPLVTWVFVLEHDSDNRTRLIVRARGGADYQAHREHWWQTTPVLRLIHFVMERKQLLGIARRAEAAAA